MATKNTTQTQHPWRTTVRTVFQALVALAAAVPFIYEAFTGNSAEAATGAVATFLTVNAGITRVMALPQVEEFLERFLPFLAAAPKTKGRHAAY